MRKMGMVVAALLLAGGVAGAVEEAARSDASVQTLRLNRWGFDAKGPNEADVAYRYCPADKLVSVNSRRTAGDWTATVLSLGWYTPAHTTVRCAR